MIKFESTDVYGFEAAIRGMRNPKNSWDKSDTDFKGNIVILGKSDFELMRTLAQAGSDHGKFLRMINVTVDITAPLYWWKEFDTYKVGTVANSCSTMHKIHAKEFTLEDFSYEHLIDVSKNILEEIIRGLNLYREEFNTTNDKKWWWQMIQLLPTSYNQKRTVQMNYEVLRHICNSRKGHKLDEWNAFITWAEQLPYFIDICKPEEHTCTCGGDCTCHKEGE